MQASIKAKGETIFNVTWDNFTKIVWNDEFKKANVPLLWPYNSTLLNNILKDSTFKFLDNINTPNIETLTDDITQAFNEAVITLQHADSSGTLEWAKYKDSKILHLIRLDALSRTHLPVGGGTNTINATTQQHGPSWRMVVSLTAQTEAYGVYPGGQSGNPGSKYYDNFVDTWTAGKYYSLWMMKSSDENNPKIKWKMTFSKG